MDVTDRRCCRGGACDVVTVAWIQDLGAYVVRNTSERTVRVELATWPRSTVLLLSREQAARLDAHRIEYPYYATYASR